MEKNTQQTSLFGGFVEEEQTPLTFVKVHEQVVAEGDQFTMNPTTAVLNDEKGCLTLIDTDKSQALTVYFENHPNAKFKSTPDGIRLGRAIERALKVGIADLGLLESAFNENDTQLTITHNGEKGRLWVVSMV